MPVGGRAARGIRFGLLALSLALIAACAEVKISSNRRAGDVDPIDPVLFVIVQGNTPPAYPRLLRYYLVRETRTRGVAAKFVTLTETELDEKQVIEGGMKGMRGVVFIKPAGGTKNRFSGEIVQIRYDARAFRVTKTRSAADPRMVPSTDSGDRGDGGATLDGGATPPAHRLAEANEGGELVSIWRASVTASRGDTSSRQEKIASDLVVRMIGEHVLSGTLEKDPREDPGVPVPDPTDD